MIDTFVPDVLRLDLGAMGAWMSSRRVDACLSLLAESDVTVADVQGSEAHPRLRELVILVRALRRRLIYRGDPLAIAAEPGLAELLAEHRVDLVAGLPAHGRPGPALLAGLRRLNAVGYGMPGTGLALDLAGSFMLDRAPAMELERVSFTQLHLVAEEGERLERLVHPGRILGLPLRSAAFVDWDGRVTIFELDDKGGRWERLLASDVGELPSLERATAPISPLLALESGAAL
jgi:hypothetical protein